MKMIDTQVLIYACRRRAPTDGPALGDLLDASRALVRHEPEIAISSLTWLEFMRAAQATERAAVAGMSLRVLDANAAVAERAAELLRLRIGDGTTCRRCLAPPGSKPCTACKKVRGATQRLNDAMIVATGEVTLEIDTLYSFDADVHDFARYVEPTRLVVERPAHASGPLFDSLLGRSR